MDPSGRWKNKWKGGWSVRKTSLRASGASTGISNASKSTTAVCTRARTHTLVEKKKKKENLNHPFGDDINAGDAP